ncbi:MAG: FAD-dependent oxidoreductase [Promethearchaeota archaeon]
MFDIIIIGAGTAGSSLANKVSKFSKTLLIEAQDYDAGIPSRTNIFAEHNKPYIDDIFWNDDNIFPRPFLQLNYKSEQHDGLLSSKEFGAPLGKISKTEIFIEKLINSFKDNDGITKFNEKIVKVNRYNDYIELINNKGESYKTKLLVLATGSRGFELQKSLGFDIPDSYSGVYTNIWADEDLLQDNFSFQYMFHFNPKISLNGPFFFNVGKERISTGYLGNKENPSELKNKLERILNNYQKIQPFIKGLKWNKNEFVTGDISKHPIKSFTNDRVLILGEAAGLVTSFFYEGILCGLLSADVAAKIIQPLLEKDSNYDKFELNKYDQEIKRILLDGYFRNGDACEYLFYSGETYSKTLWITYTDLLNTNKTVRKYVYEAHMIQNLWNYDTDRDRWVGEKLFGALPTLSKLILWPKFLKAMMK